MATFLLEVRTEEIPANALGGARRQLSKAYFSALAEAGFGDCTVRILSTNLRLVVVVDGLPARQPDRSEQVTGPPVRVAYAEDGSPTRAAEGFARKVGLEVDALETVTTDKGEYLFAVVKQPGRDTIEILAEITPAIVRGLHFPKMMRWGLGTYNFVRPVHGVVALFDDEVVDFELFGVSSGRETVGHRVHSPETLAIDTASAYVDELRRRKVLVVPEERREILESRATELAAEVGCTVHPDPGLVAEHVELVEYPGLLRGEIEARFLELPPEVVVITLRHHQKCLILEDAEGELAAHFLAVVDREDDPEGLIRLGNEWVIGARLADAEFFFDEDRKRPLQELAPGLVRLDFHRTLGSLGDKASRVAELAGVLAEWIGAPLDRADLERASRLVKADLLSNMVNEFPELQGVMGGHYLRLEGEPEELWTAARDHYRPVGFEGELPTSATGRIIAAADRLDTLAGLFAVGEVPTGSRDPFGLRRAAQALVRIAAESGWPLHLDNAIGCAVALVEAAVDCDGDATHATLRDFVADRVRRYLTGVVGISGDTAEAVMAAGWAMLPDLVARGRALESARTSPEFRALSLAFKRVRNITDGEPDGGVDNGLFEQDEERELWRETSAFHEALPGLLEDGNLDEAFAAMGPIAEVLDRFFVEVLVMSDTERVRENRIALLKTLGRDFLTLADLSKLQVKEADNE